MCQIDPDLDILYPDELRPIKGYLYTYFRTDLHMFLAKKNGIPIDLQDNTLCNCISVFLKSAHSSLGRNLYIDILYNDLNTHDYFEVYSDLNLKRLQAEIEQKKQKLFAILDKPQQFHSENNYFDKSKMNHSILRLSKTTAHSSSFLFETTKEEERRLLMLNVKLIFELHRTEDKIANDLIKTYAEYYNNLLKPLVDSLEILKQEIARYDRKVCNQEKTTRCLKNKASSEALNKLKNDLEKHRIEASEVLDAIDNINVDYKQKLIGVLLKITEKIVTDKEKFIKTSKNSINPLFYEYITKDRLKR
jgi:hypothetical protein